MDMIFKGTDEEFEALINANKAAVCGTAYAYSGCNSEIDDVAQETFICAYYNFGALKDADKLGAWLCGIARNISLKKLRSARGLSFDELGELQAPGDVEAGYIERESAAEVRRAVAALSKPVGETVALHYFAGKSIRQISSLLSVPEGTVKSRLHDGRKQLKGELIHMIEKESACGVGEKLAEEVRRLRDSGQASAACARCGSAIAAAGEKRENYGLLAELYRLRASTHGMEQEKAVADSEKSVAYAKLFGDKRLLAECLLSAAFDFDGAPAERCLAEAYETAKASGRGGICAEAAFWLGADAIKAGDYEKAEAYFTDSLANSPVQAAASVSDPCLGVETRTHALASAALASMRGLGGLSRLDKSYAYISLNSFCQLLRVSGNRIVSDNNYGWDIPGLQRRPQYYHRFFGHFEGQGLVMSLALLKNGSDEHEYYAWNGVLVKRRYELLSRDARVRVAAGSYERCLHVRICEEVPGCDQSDPEQRSVFEQLDACEQWYAPDVGLVRSVYAMPNTPDFPAYSYELASCAVTPSSAAVQRYFPLTLGNRWEYVVFDGSGRPYSRDYTYSDAYEVDRISQGIAYISNSGYAFEAQS